MHSQIFQEPCGQEVTCVTGATNNTSGPVILLVEDEDFVLEATAEALRGNGYCVLTARSAADAVALFSRHGSEVRLLLTDLVLPGQNGRRLASYLRDLHPGFRTLFMSGYPENATKKHSGNYVPKPFSFALLLAKVQEALRG